MRYLSATVALTAGLVLFASGAAAQPPPEGMKDYDILKEIDARKKRYEHHPPAPTPPDDPDLPGITPTEAGVRRYVWESLGAIARRVRLRPVVLDFDPEDEILAVIPLHPNEETPTTWVLLLDRRGDRTVVLRQWVESRVDATVHVVAHSFGRRAALIAHERGEGASTAEVLQLGPGGELTTLASFRAVDPHALDVLRVEEGWTIVMDVGRPDLLSWWLVAREEGFTVEPEGEVPPGADAGP